MSKTEFNMTRTKNYTETVNIPDKGEKKWRRTICDQKSSCGCDEFSLCKCDNLLYIAPVSGKINDNPRTKTKDTSPLWKVHDSNKVIFRAKHQSDHMIISDSISNQQTVQKEEVPIKSSAVKDHNLLTDSRRSRSSKGEIINSTTKSVISTRGSVRAFDDQYYRKKDPGILVNLKDPVPGLAPKMSFMVDNSNSEVVERGFESTSYTNSKHQSSNDVIGSKIEQKWEALKTKQHEGSLQTTVNACLEEKNSIRGSSIDNGMVIRRDQYSNQSSLSVIKTTVHALNLSCVQPKRAGVIPYTVSNGAIYFGLGLDSKTHDLTDFAGGVFYKTDHDVVQGALREFEEETLQIFDSIKADDIKECPVIYDSDNLIIFIHMNIDPDVICSVFNDKYQEVMRGIKLQQLIDAQSKTINKIGKIEQDSLDEIKDTKINTPKEDRIPMKWIEPEVCGITWLTWEEFQRSIREKDKGIMFSRVRRFLSRAGDFSYLL